MNQQTYENLSIVREELIRLGYEDRLIQDDYVFDDAYSEGIHELRVPLATFSNWPPSYRTACIGVLVANGESGPKHVSSYRALGAPMFFEVSQDRADRFQLTAAGEAVHLESISIDRIPEAFEMKREEWNPNAIFRAKAIAPRTAAVQLDFIDLGLLPALKGMIHKKLDRLLKEILFEADEVHKIHASGHEPDQSGLFRLVFRCLAAKIFKDRDQSNDWDVSDAGSAIRRVQKFYGIEESDSGRILREPNTQQLVWEKFRGAFNFQNISVDDLAYVYENTLIRKETRKQFGIHSTPPVIAELMVDRLPFESLNRDDRHVLEPCAGHGVFLIASLRRLRELLPASWTNLERHDYLKGHLTAIEMDAFAAEVCRLSLSLADYPNPNGWKIISEDVFSTDVLNRQLKRGRIVLCNPPFEDFTMTEKQYYGKSIENLHKPYELLRRVLLDPPAMFGFVLPKSAVVGERYRNLLNQIARFYTEVETMALPDRIYAFSDQETMLVLAWNLNREKKDILTRTFWIRDIDRPSLLNLGQLPDKGIPKLSSRSAIDNRFRIWNPPLSEVWSYLEDYPKLEDVSDIHRGIEWNISLVKNRELLVSPVEKSGYRKGLDTTKRKVEPYYATEFVYLNMDEQYQRTSAHRCHWDKEKVIVSGRRASRNHWRIIGFPDRDGMVGYQSIIGIWPTYEFSIDVISAIINSPIANAMVFCNSYGRDNTVKAIEKIRIPPLVAIDAEKISYLVGKYRMLRYRLGSETYIESITMECIDILFRIDAIILKAYDLPPKLERKLLEFFREQERPLPFRFPDYYPKDFKPYIPFHKFIEMNIEQASAGELLKRIAPLDSEGAHDLVLALERG